MSRLSDGQVRGGWRAAVLVAGLIALASWDVAGAGERSGWTVFRTVQSTQFRGNVLTGQGYADMSAALYNPAVPATFHRGEALLISERGSVDDMMGAALVGVPLSRKVMLGVGAAYYDAGAAEMNWEDAAGITRSETVCLQRDTMGMLSVGYAVSRSFAAGVSVKGATCEIAEQRTASAYAADAGVLFQPLRMLTFSAALQNAGSATKFIDEADPLPTAGYAGMGVGLASRRGFLLVSAGVTYLVNEQENIPEAGLECDYGGISFNGGYRLADDLDSALHIGFSFAEKNFTIGYAYVPGKYLGDTHRMAISYAFQPL